MESHNEAHGNDLEWLTNEVKTIELRKSEEERRRKILIVTHHVPCVRGTSEPRHVDSPLNSAFATDLIVDGKDWDGVKMWVYRHTHYSTEFLRESVRVVSNQRGYVFPGQEAKIPEGYGKGKWKAFDVKSVISI